MMYLIYGDIPLELKYDELIKRIKDENPNITEKYFDAFTGEEDKFLESISFNSLFGGMELIVLKRINSIKKADKFIKLLDNFSISNKIVVVTYEETLDDYGKAKNPLNKTSALMKVASKSFKLVEARQATEKKSLLFFVAKELNISEGDAKTLLDMTGDNTSLVKNEVEKIKRYLNGSDFSFEKVEGIISYSKEYSINFLIDEFLQGKVDNLLNHLKMEKDYMKFLYVLTSEIDTLYKLKLFEEKGTITPYTSYNQFKGSIYDNLKGYFLTATGRPLHPYPLFLKLKSLNRFSSDFLFDRSKEILKIEYLFKSGQGEEAVLVESFIGTFHSK